MHLMEPMTCFCERRDVWIVASYSFDGLYHLMRPGDEGCVRDGLCLAPCHTYLLLVAYLLRIRHVFASQPTLVWALTPSCITHRMVHYDLDIRTQQHRAEHPQRHPQNTRGRPSRASPMALLLRSFSTITVLLCAVLLLPRAAHALWPQPRNLQTGSAALRLGPSFAIHVAVPNAPKDLLAAAERTRALLSSDKLGRLVVGRGVDDLPAVRRAKALSALTLRLLGGTSGAPRPIATEATLPLGSRDEAYSLVVPADGSAAVLSANSTLGLFRGLTTFGQLWYTASGTVYTLGTPVAIQDSPAYVRLHRVVRFWRRAADFILFWCA